MQSDKVVHKLVVSVCLLFLAGLFAKNTHAQAMDWNEEYAKRIASASQLSPLSGELFGEQISLFNGTVVFRHADISLAGNNALPVALVRTYNTPDASAPRLLKDWDLEVPHLVATHPASATGGWAPLNRCSSTAAPPDTGTGNSRFTARDYWSGTKLDGVQDGGELVVPTADARLVKPSVANTKWTTKSRWFFTCLSSLKSPHQGEGFLGHAPDGTKYYFDWLVTRTYPGIARKNPSSLVGVFLNRTSMRLYVTKVVDRFGNQVNYSWSDDKLISIASSDGRRITLAYESGQLSSASDGTHTWTYGYAAAGGLVSVTRPDGSSWRFSRSGGGLNRIAYVPNPRKPPQYVTEYPLVCSSVSSIDASSNATFEITTPSGATGQFRFTPIRHGRTNVRYECFEGTDDDYRSDYNAYSLYQDVMSLQSKTVSGPGLATMTTSYRYDGLSAGYAQENPQMDAITGATPLPHFKTVVVSEPDGKETAYTFGKDFGVNEGQLVRTVISKAGQTIQDETVTYTSEAEASAAAYAPTVGTSLVAFGDPFSATAIRPVKARKLVRDAWRFEWVGSDFDSIARPRTQRKSSAAAP